MPGFFAVGHDRGSGRDRGHVQIVTAGVHHGNVASGIILCAYDAGVCKTSLLFYRKGVEFSTKHDRRTRPVFENGPNPSAANILPDLTTKTSQPATPFTHLFLSI